MAVTVADVAVWAQQSVPEAESDDEIILARLLAAVTARAVTYFRLDADPAEWSADQDQAVIEVTAEQWIGARNTQFGEAEFDNMPGARANSIDYGLKRRLGVPAVFA